MRLFYHLKKNNRRDHRLVVLYCIIFDYLDIEQVNIFGFDWKQTNSFYQDEATEKRVNTPHDYTDEKKVCTQLIEKRGWKLYQ